MDTYLLISLIANLVLMVFLLVFMYSVYMHDKQFDKDRKALHLDASRSIEDSHKRAKEIVEQAVSRAQDILLKTQYIRDDIIKNLEHNLSDVSDATVKMVREEALSFNQEYKTLLESIQVEHAKMLEEARSALQDVEYLKKEFHTDLMSEVKLVLEEAHKSVAAETDKFDAEYAQLLSQTKQEYMAKAEEALKILERIPEQEMKEFKEVLQKESLSAQKLLGNRINELFSAAEKEVDAYKQQRISEVKTQLESATETILEEVIGKKLSRQDHEVLVMKALDKVKLEGSLPKKEDQLT